jgi:hypothetical protein
MDTKKLNDNRVIKWVILTCRVIKDWVVGGPR